MYYNVYRIWSLQIRLAKIRSESFIWSVYKYCVSTCPTSIILLDNNIRIEANTFEFNIAQLRSVFRWISGWKIVSRSRLDHCESTEDLEARITNACSRISSANFVVTSPATFCTPNRDNRKSIILSIAWRWQWGSRVTKQAYFDASSYHVDRPKSLSTSAGVENYKNIVERWNSERLFLSRFSRLSCTQRILLKLNATDSLRIFMRL